MGLVRVGERMKRARRRMAVAERVARTERKRRVPNMVVVFAVLAVSEVGWRGGVVYCRVEERRGRGREGGGVMGACEKLPCFLNSCLSCPPALGSRRAS